LELALTGVLLATHSSAAAKSSDQQTTLQRCRGHTLHLKSAEHKHCEEE